MDGRRMIPSFSDAQLEQLARTLGECGSGTDITRVLSACGLEDRSSESTKWRQLCWVFQDCQQRDRCANNVAGFIRSFLDPVRFIGHPKAFEEHRASLNMVLAFSGLSYGPDGQFRQVGAVTTLPEAEERARTVRAKLQHRTPHTEVLKYCKAELMQDNYFHAVFEAVKGLAQRIRDESGATSDGTKLVDEVFSINRPMLAFNSLQTETEHSEHKGFAALLKGCFAAVRNPLAHTPKILWEGEDDAADYFTLVSMLHRKLDVCFKVP
jgi:uncharacterized protein (TIGR02391 family)